MKVSPTAMPHPPAVQPVTTTGVATDSMAAEMASLLKKALAASEPSRTLDTRKANRANPLMCLDGVELFPA